MGKGGRRFDFLEHVSDVYVAAYGKSLEEAFENVALAMFEAMTDVKLVEDIVHEEVVVEGEDEEALLYNWLEMLLIRFEVDGMLFSEFKVKKISKLNGGLRLEATVFGEMYDAEKHTSKVGIKAVTYHMMEIRKENRQVTVKVLLDI